MEFEFDKEIDAILRQARTDSFVSADNPKSAIQNPKSDHLDADELSAFAENALPEKTKQLYIRHLADCGRCRRMLSNLISLNSEAEIEAASSVVAEPKKIAEPVIPWYRKLFLFPQLTYTMGVFVIIFSGFLAYLFVQNTARNSNISDVSQVRERPQNMSGASSDGETTSVEMSRSSANTAANMSNSATVSSSSNSMMSNAASNAASSNSAANSSAAPRKEPVEREKDASSSRDDELAKAENQPMPVAAAPPSAQPLTLSQTKPQLEESRVSDDKEKTAKKSESENKKPVDNATTNNDSAAGASAMRSAPAPKMMSRKTDTSETKQTGGRNFTRKNGVWYDANYNNQPTTNISRGSSDYKKLDSGLRSIAESLSGTVVVVWKSKAYRIQ